MTEYQITRGDTPARDGEDYGQFTGGRPAEAVEACLLDGDPTRRYTVAQLSESADYGRGDHRVNGNGAQSRDDWYYVTEVATGRFCGIFTGTEAVHE